MNRFLISAAHKSSGKTIVSVGLAAALRQRGLSVAAFKKGPDYIDPMWLGQASGSPCWNLDFFTMHSDEITACYRRRSHGADVALVEGNKGLHDGLDVEGGDSNAALAKQLDLPVVLVIDVTGITRGIAPLLTGYTAFDPAVGIAGVILNRVAGPRQETKLRAAVERYTALPVLGVPIQSEALKGMDSLLSTVQMPAGVPGATLAIGRAGAINAALLAAAILGLSDPAVARALDKRRAAQSAAVPEKPD